MAICYVRKYDEYKQRLADKRADIRLSTPPPPDGQPKSGTPGDSTARKTQLLLELENTHKAKVVKAVEKARDLIGDDLFASEDREMLRREIWDSCLGRISFVHTKCSMIMGETKFWEYRRQFLRAICDELGL